MSFKPLVIASRQSPLAVKQAELVRATLAEAMNVPLSERNTAFPLKSYVSTGDKLMTPTLSEIGGKGLFTKEVEEALLSGEADIAVHSMKDMPAEMPEGLVLAAIPPREDFRDALVSPDGITLNALPQGARVGTSSIRRRAQLARLRPDIELLPMRGNVGTRLEKLSRGEADATFLAEAGLLRLGHSHVKRVPLSPDEMLPAPGQGILCVQSRAGDDAALSICTKINCKGTAIVSAAERALVRRLDASCKTPLAALAEIKGNDLLLRAEMLMPDGTAKYADQERVSVNLSATGSINESTHLGDSLAGRLIGMAGDNLARIYGAS